MATISGTSGNDNVSGTIFDDILNRDGDPLSYPGTGGGDTVYGYEGDDRLYGGSGKDLLNSGLENDSLSGGTDQDLLLGDSGDDQLYGGSDHDKLYGGNGHDLLDGGTGLDYMEGGAGSDLYIVDDAGDVVLGTSNDVYGGEADRVEASVTYTIGTGVEVLNLTGEANINGTGNDDDNSIIGNDANNVLSGLAGDDNLSGSDGNDQIFGGSGEDKLYGNDDNDQLFGGTDNDALLGGRGNDLLDGGSGVDDMGGGAGNDIYIVDHVGDMVTETSNDALGGIDLVKASVTHMLSFGIEHLTLTGSAAINGTGNGNNNNILGNRANNVLSGLDGNDILIGGAGNDTLIGGNGNDVLTGGSGRDQLNGGAGNDRFDYNAVSESPTGTSRDVITDFAGAGTALGDQIDLRDIDANVLVSGNQAFTWKGASPGGAGTLWYSGGVLHGNVDGDAMPEFEIQLVGIPGLSVGGTGTDILL